MTEETQPTTEKPPANDPRRDVASPGLVYLIDTVAKHVEPTVKILTTILEQNLRSKNAEARFKTGMAIVAVVLVVFVVSVAAWLTYLGRLDGSTFGFLLGLIVGYVLTFVRDAIYPPRE